MAAKKKAKKKEFKLDIRDVLARLDRGDMRYFETLGEAEQKAFEPYVVTRFLSAVAEGEDRDLAAYQISAVNAAVNCHYSDLTKHPELQWKLMASCGLGVKRYHPWIAPGGRTRKTSRTDALLRRFAPGASETEIAVLRRVNQPADLLILAEDFGMTDAEIQDLRKELGKSLMAAKKKFPKPTEKAPHQCQFCGRLFSRESSLISHTCERKRRHFARDERWVKMAFAIFERTYRLLGIARSRSTAMTYDDFADSQFYAGFVRFARHAADLHVENIQQFADWLVKNTIPLDDWCRMATYEQYLKWVVENEPAATAVERNVLFMEKWAEETGHPYTDFFRAISPGEALVWIRTARISPWMMFLSETGGDLIARMTEEQQALLDQAVDIAKWKRKFLARSDDREWVKQICGQFGL